MKTIKEPINYTQIINKSTFICYLFPIKSFEEGLVNLNNIKKKHYDATHNCYSMIIGTQTISARSNDDGEPSKTAGIPIFEVLKKNNLTNIQAIVTRYFGGIKLGAGGLIRAYSSTVSKALENAIIEEIKFYEQLTFEVKYDQFEEVSMIMNNCNLIDKNFSNVVLLKYSVDKDEIDSIIDKLITATKNTIIFK